MPCSHGDAGLLQDLESYVVRIFPYVSAYFDFALSEATHREVVPAIHPPGPKAGGTPLGADGIRGQAGGGQVDHCPTAAACTVAVFHR